jgi:Ca-activated chloride channel homolog
MRSSILYLAVGLILAIAPSVYGQARCFTPEEASRIINSIKGAPRPSVNKKLREELLKMQETRAELNLRIIDQPEKNEKLVAEASRMGDAHFLRLCRMIKENGWLTDETVSTDGAAAILFLIKNNKTLELQKEFFPVLVAAVEKGLIGKGNLASAIDTIRVASGLPQLFGTQTQIKNDAFYLYPLLNEDRIDKWRALYDLPPLAVFIKELEVRYRMIVVKSSRLPVAPVLKEKTILPVDESAALKPESEESDVLKVETKVVNLNVRVLNEDLSAAPDLNLKKEDFAVYENDVEQEITFFSTTDKPFDLILLLDLSGSTEAKRDLIIESTRRFIEAARAGDRIAIVVFTHESRIVADLTTDKKNLLEKIKEIKDSGGSKVWDGLKFTYEKVIKMPREGRRSAIVLMTDGVDNSLSQDIRRWERRDRPDPVTGINYFDAADAPSDVTFTELLETVRQGETTIFPIYLDTETLYATWVKKAYRQARQTLEMLAEETGGRYYYAKNIKDLNGIYEKVIDDLSHVYSLGYEPKNDTPDGSWRGLTVRVKDRPKLITRTKRGYYAK